MVVFCYIVLRVFHIKIKCILNCINPTPFNTYNILGPYKTEKETFKVHLQELHILLHNIVKCQHFRLSFSCVQI